MDYCPKCLQQYDEGLCGCDLAQQLAESLKTQEELEEDKDAGRDESEPDRS